MVKQRGPPAGLTVRACVRACVRTLSSARDRGGPLQRKRCVRRQKRLPSATELAKASPFQQHMSALRGKTAQGR